MTSSPSTGWRGVYRRLSVPLPDDPGNTGEGPQNMPEVTIDLPDELVAEIDERIVQTEVDRVADRFPDEDREEIEAKVRAEFANSLAPKGPDRG